MGWYENPVARKGRDGSSPSLGNPSRDRERLLALSLSRGKRSLFRDLPPETAILILVRTSD